MQIESIALTNVGLVRSMNQDAILEIPEHGIFLVADGMGGEKAGEEASAQVIETIKRKFGKFFQDEPTGPSQIEGEMRDGLLSANSDVFQISVREPEKRGLGSTASLLCLHRGVYFAAQVGDSRIYLMREGSVHQITRDHTLVWALYEQGAITREQLETHPDRHLLTQCIGNERPVKVDTFMGQIQVGDTFLICSDGLTGYAKEPRVFDILKMEEVGLKERGDMMIQAALDAGGGDNVSVVMARVTALETKDDWEPEATAPPAKFSEEETEHAFATSVHHQIIEPEREPRKTPWLGWIGVALGLIGLIGIFVFIGKDHSGGAVKVYIDRSPTTPKSVQVHLFQGDRELPTQTIMTDKDGDYFTLPGGGKYRVKLSSDGYISPSDIAVSVKTGDTPLVLRPIEWVAQPTLTLLIPPSPPITRIKVSGEGGEEMVFEKDKIEQAGRRLVVPVQPGVTYTVVAQSDGIPDFNSPQQQVAAGQERTLPIFFAGGPAPTQ